MLLLWMDIEGRMGRRKRGNKGGKGKPLTAEELDAQLDAYALKDEGLELRGWDLFSFLTCVGDDSKGRGKDYLDAQLDEYNASREKGGASSSPAAPAAATATTSQ